ncbi:hypothetical protein [Domibacillus robiginosus]|uniref:hypothetical protein n=1 Tax=Domibacillus robiginosus TaxID=1071054 RepID=UPI00067BBA7C|nr:hypothetical protein [Domibacillus robiginosus]
MKMLYTGEKMIIDGDESLLAKIEGKSLEGIDITDIQVEADELARLFDIASATETVESIGRYAMVKEKYLTKYNA